MVGNSVPFMAAVLLLEVMLLVLALLVAAFGILVKPVRRLARGLAAAGLLSGIAMGFGAAEEMRRTDYPLVRPGSPFGSYTQPTDLMLIEMVVAGLVTVAAALLSFRRPLLAGLLFVVAGVWNLSGSVRQYQDPTMPPGNATFGVMLAGLPPLVVGALLLATWWADRRKAPSAASGVTPPTEAPGAPGALGATPKTS